MNQYEGSASSAWTAMVQDLLLVRRGELNHVTICINNFSEETDCFAQGTRNRLDNFLRQRGKPQSHTVANTIFPLSLWDPSQPSQNLYARYSSVWPKIKKYRENKNGVYFRRMTAYGNGSQSTINQLDRIINNYNSGNHRRSAGQIEIYDPSKDLVNSRQRGFPCLRSVTVLPKDGKLELVGQYILQYAIAKSYGNLIGLCRLGRFMAHYMNIELQSVRCHALIETLDISKKDARAIMR